MALIPLSTVLLTFSIFSHSLSDVGDSVAVDEVVTTLETDKVSVDVRSPAAGTITERLVNVQAVVPIGAALAKLKVGAAAAAAPKVCIDGCPLRLLCVCALIIAPVSSSQCRLTFIFLS
jgi:pyruvate/2-oxoglutarate dehydrogenase complex dihydrolipoamide acyltransferase (E2) component